MPRSSAEIIADGERFAAIFEAPRPGDLSGRLEPQDEPVEAQFVRAVYVRGQAERRLAEVVRQARSQGTTWRRVGEMPGTSEQLARARYRPLLEYRHGGRGGLFHRGGAVA